MNEETERSPTGNFTDDVLTRAPNSDMEILSRCAYDSGDSCATTASSKDGRGRCGVGEPGVDEQITKRHAARKRGNNVALKNIMKCFEDDYSGETILKSKPQLQTEDQQSGASNSVVSSQERSCKPSNSRGETEDQQIENILSRFSPMYPDFARQTFSSHHSHSLKRKTRQQSRSLTSYNNFDELTNKKSQSFHDCQREECHVDSLNPKVTERSIIDERNKRSDIIIHEIECDGQRLSILCTTTEAWSTDESSEDENNCYTPYGYDDTIERNMCNNAPNSVDSLSKIPSDTNIEKHIAQVGEYFLKLYEQRKIIDVLIHVGDSTFPAHRVPLACHSKYFANIFLDQSVSETTPVELRIEGIRPDLFALFVSYVYTGNVTLSSEIVGDMAVICEVLDVPHLYKVCNAYLENLPLDEAFVALTNSNTECELFEKIFRMVLVDFYTLLHSNVFWGIDIDSIVRILSHNALQVVREIDVFKAGLQWIMFAFEQRREYVDRIMACVRFPFMSSKDLYTCLSVSDLVAGSSYCRQAILEANWIASMRFHDLDDPLEMELPSQRIQVQSIQDEEEQQTREECHAESLNPKVTERRIIDERNKRSDIITHEIECDDGQRLSILCTATEAWSTDESSEDEINCYTPYGYDAIIESNMCNNGPNSVDSLSKMQPDTNIEKHIAQGDDDSIENEFPDQQNNNHDDLCPVSPILSEDFSLQMSSEKEFYEDTLEETLSKEPSFMDTLPLVTEMSLPDMMLEDQAAGINDSVEESNALFEGEPGGTMSDSSPTNGLKPELEGTKPEGQSAEHYETVKNNWGHYTSLPESRHHHAVAVLNGLVYVIGGSRPKESGKSASPVASTYRFDTDKKEWTQVAALNTPRMFHSVCALYGMVYAIGGQDEKNRVLNTVECYNPIIDTWTYVAPMHHARFGFGAANLGGRIFAVGGCGEVTEKTDGITILDSVECFSPRTNRWEEKKPINIPLCYLSLVNASANLYLCGGATYSENSTLKSVGRVSTYNRGLDTWKHKTDMAVPRHNAGATVIGTKFYIIGGFSTEENQTLQSIECYDTFTDMWDTDLQEIPYPAKWLSCVTLPSSG